MEKQEGWKYIGTLLAGLVAAQFFPSFRSITGNEVTIKSVQSSVAELKRSLESFRGEYRVDQAETKQDFVTLRQEFRDVISTHNAQTAHPSAVEYLIRHSEQNSNQDDRLKDLERRLRELEGPPSRGGGGAGGMADSGLDPWGGPVFELPPLERGAPPADVERRDGARARPEGGPAGASGGKPRQAV